MTATQAQIKAVRKYNDGHYVQIKADIEKDLAMKARAKSKATGVSLRSVIIQALINFIEE